MSELWEQTYRNTLAALQAERTAAGHWVGELSSSALSTAVAVFTLSLHHCAAFSSEIRAGLDWLKQTQNADGGFGDTIKSKSNISTTALCWAAFSCGDEGDSQVIQRIEAWLTREAGSLEPNIIAAKITSTYGKDRTFSVPILTMLTIAGKLGADGWKLIPQLPFELAALPFSWFQVLRLPVVSYALPALIAMGLVRHTHRPTWLLPWRWLRKFVTPRCLRKLRAIQPTTGGYLEATPLTGFVCMSLIHAGFQDEAVVLHGCVFLMRSLKKDGSWPIDTNLSTWVTTLSINAGAIKNDTDEQRNYLEQWLLNQQGEVIHPYTQAKPGAWAWTDLSGGVPDADDTPGALLALVKLKSTKIDAAERGCQWLLDVQNSDGGIPTFCRGWTGLPFDRSSNDLTAHTLRAWAAWYPIVSKQLQQRLTRGRERAVRYLQQTQMQDGQWLPLWFGNEHLPAGAIQNATYGTAKVMMCAGLPGCEALMPDLGLGAAWLLNHQNEDGGWGAGRGTASSIEETALALEALSHFGAPAERLQGGYDWLCNATHQGTHFPPSPIGFYFANLWYYEKLYPIIFTLAAFESLHGSAQVRTDL